MWRIGIDLGGTKIEALALSPEGEEYGRRRVPTPRGDYDATLQAAAGLTSALVAAVGRENVAGVGIVKPAPQRLVPRVRCSSRSTTSTAVPGL
jgi:fructokinase